MRVIQLLTTISYGDAVSNDALALDAALRRVGFQTGIFAENIGKRIPDNYVKYVSRMPKLKPEDIVIYHLSTGTPLNYELPRLGGRKILIYHNITPYNYFSGYSHTAWQLCKDGIEGARYLSDKVEYCLADSDFNRQDLKRLGYKCKIDVLPILIPFSDYDKEPNKKIIEQYSSDGFINILFTGRIAPNKCQEDVIAAFFKYYKYYNEKSRLILVGNYEGMENYYNKLKKYVEHLEIEGNVIFTGHIGFDEILAYYQISDLFLCMSEHEGFCVPLVEAMYFNLPIVAYDSTAITDTLGGSGFLIKEKRPLEVAGAINYIIENMDVRNSIVLKQRTRLIDFKQEPIEKRFFSYLNSFLGKD